ncbi:MAG: glycosyltransferase family 2 protein [Bdellovibrionales bacterium]|nr:glycosyltransferase family 2 protein [Bdellovibrionales bacterium]
MTTMPQNPLPLVPNNKTISVVICAYNEERTVGLVLEKLNRMPWFNEIICVNNGSTDGTRDILKAWGTRDSRIQLVEVEKNQGLGHGLCLGIQKTTGDIVVRQDADLEYDPEELLSLVEPIAKGHGQVCFGSRMLVRKAHRAQYYYNYLANLLFTFIADLLSNMNLTDVETAAKAFDGPLIRSIPFFTKGFQIEIEMLFKLRARGAVFYEVPISYYGRSLAEGKKIRLKDAFTTLWALFTYGVFWKFLK